MSDNNYLPILGEGWDWHESRFSVDGHQKSRLALIDPTDTERAYGTIDLEFYGERGVLELGRQLVDRVARQQLEST